jgi:alanine dehydrogenase
MRIGVLREIRREEFRVALTPAGAHELSTSGHEVTVETAAGKGSGFADDHYRAAGAPIAATASEVSVPVSSTRALTNATFPCVELIARYGIEAAIKQVAPVAARVNVACGVITHHAVADAHHLPFEPVSTVLAAGANAGSRHVAASPASAI